jgi:hypothetical protein
MGRPCGEVIQDYKVKVLLLPEPRVELARQLSKDWQKLGLTFFSLMCPDPQLRR